jgi:hypothetical protein
MTESRGSSHTDAAAALIVKLQAEAGLLEELAGNWPSRCKTKEKN